MATPVVEEVTTEGFGNGTSFVVDMPATVNAGDLLILIFTCEDGNIDTDPGGWTILSSTGVAQGDMQIYIKDATGSETTATVGVDATTTALSHVWRIQTGTWEGTLATAVDTSSVNDQGNTSSPNPPAVTAGWGSDTNLFITTVGARDDAVTVDSYPTNYSGNQTGTTQGGTNDGCSLGSASRALTAASDDPGTFSLSSSDRTSSFTIVVQPFSAATRQRGHIIGGSLPWWLVALSPWLVREGPATRRKFLAPWSMMLLSLFLTGASTGVTFTGVELSAGPPALRFFQSFEGITTDTCTTAGPSGADASGAANSPDCFCTENQTPWWASDLGGLNWACLPATGPNLDVSVTFENKVSDDITSGIYVFDMDFVVTNSTATAGAHDMLVMRQDTTDRQKVLVSLDPLSIRAECADGTLGSTHLVQEDTAGQLRFEVDIDLDDATLYWDEGHPIGTTSVSPCNDATVATHIDGFEFAAFGSTSSEYDANFDNIGLCAGARAAGDRCKSAGGIEPPWDFEDTGCADDSFDRGSAGCDCDIADPAGGGNTVARTEGNNTEDCVSKQFFPPTRPNSTYCIEFDIRLVALPGTDDAIVRIRDVGGPNLIIIEQGASGWRSDINAVEFESTVAITLDQWFHHAITINPSVPEVVVGGWLIDGIDVIQPVRTMAAGDVDDIRFINLTDTATTQYHYYDNVEVSSGACATDFRTDANCQGAWLMFDDGTENGAEANRCTTGDQDNMVWQGGGGDFPGVTTDAPVGSPPGTDAVFLDGVVNQSFSITGSGTTADEFKEIDFTAGCWFRDNNGATGGAMHGGDGNHWTVFAGSSEGISAVIGDGTTESSAAGVYQLDEWFQVILRYCGSGTSCGDAVTDATELMLNGGVDICDGGCSVGNTPNKGTEDILLGVGIGGGDEWDGSMGLCWYEDRPLTNVEIAEIFLCGKDGKANGFARDAVYGTGSCTGSGTPWSFCTGFKTGGVGCGDITTCC